MNDKLGKVIQKIKPLTENIGIDNFLRMAFVESRLVGERINFAVIGRPQTSSAVLLAGSGRSGTTWISDVLCALPGVQQIFEPLHPFWNANVRDITGWDSFEPNFQQIYLRAYEEHPFWLNHWEQILTGYYRNYWTDYVRTSWFPQRFLVKEIRANMMLEFLYRHFQLRIVYIMRHPCAVVQSRLGVKWHANIQDILNQISLVDDFLKPWVSTIERERDLVVAHALWWAVENLVALRQLETIPHYLVFYEDLVLKPDETIVPLLDWLGYDAVPVSVLKAFSKPSRMSSKRLSYHSEHDRLSRWQRSLPAVDQMRILEWVELLGLTMYNRYPLPQIQSGPNVH